MPTADPFPDIFGGALDAPAEAVPAVPSGASADVAAAKAAIDRAFATQRDAILQAAAAQGPALMGAAAAEHNVVLAAIGLRESAARGIFEHARATVRTHEATQIGLVRSEAATIARRLREASAVRNAFRDAVDSEARRLTAMARIGGTIITVSGTGLFPKIDLAAGMALGRAKLDLGDGDGTAALSEVDAAKAAVREQVEDWIIADRVALTNGAARSGRALNQSGHQLQAEVTRPLIDASDEITSAGAMLAEAITAGATSQIEALATAERSVLAGIVQNRRQVAGILQVGRLAGGRLMQQASADVTSLAGRQGAAHQALDAAAAAGPEALAAARERQVAAAGRAAQPIIDGLRAAPRALTAVVAERRDQLGSGIDQQLGLVSTQLAQLANGFAAECTGQRGLAQQDYAASEIQLVGQAMAQLAPARALWKLEVDRFVASVGEAAVAVQAQHAQFAIPLDDAFVGIARRAVADNRRSGAERAAGGALRGARGLVTGARNVGVGIGKMLVIGAAGQALGGLGILAAGAYMAYGVVQGAQGRVEALQATWQTRSTYEQVVGVVETIAVVAGDQFGATPLLEGLMRHEAITHRPLSDEEVGVKAGEGAAAAISLGVVKRVAGGKAGPAETPPKPLPPGLPAPKPIELGSPHPRQLGAGPENAVTATEPPMASRPSAMKDAPKRPERPRGPEETTLSRDAPTTVEKPPANKHVHEGDIETDPRSPYHGKWSGGGLHTWEAIESVVKRDGYRIKEVIEDPATGVRRVTIERVGVDPRTGQPVTGTIKKTIYPKELSKAQIDRAAEVAFQAAQQGVPGTKLDAVGRKPDGSPNLRRDGTQADGFFEATVPVGDRGINAKIQGWFKETPDGTKIITSHAPAFDRTWPTVDPGDY